ncbi:MAG: Rrf2 family transcriptional regulator [Anaerolineales bacterium]|nr:Rrf2 family transcriptional regulator [Anaerolineales bacterium]
MQLTRQADYAIRAVLYLAEHKSDQRITTAEVGREQRIPLTFLTKIMAQLSAAGLVHATRGSRGGITLARPAEDVSLLDIVEAIEGPVQLNACASDPSSCPMGDTCRVQVVWCDAQADLVNRLKNTSFASLTQPPVSVPVSVSASPA